MANPAKAFLPGRLVGDADLAAACCVHTARAQALMARLGLRGVPAIMAHLQEGEHVLDTAAMLRDPAGLIAALEGATPQEGGPTGRPRPSSGRRSSR